MTSNLVNRVGDFCQKNGLLAGQDGVVVGVSGGADSLCLLHVLVALRPQLNLTLTVAHLNHQLRGADAQADADFVKNLAAQWQLSAVVEACDVAALAGERKQSLEETARQVRYAFLWRVATEVKANKIAVAHHADDQVETVLMHFLRGAGLAGLRGMLPIMDLAALRLNPAVPPPLVPSPQLIRPLLETPRGDIEAYCMEQQLSPRFDFSNLDTTFFRNRLRYELIPLLETYNPNLRQTLLRTAKVVTAEVDFFNDQLEQTWPVVVRSETGESIELDRPAWLKLPLALKRSTLRRAVQTLRRSLRNINFEHIETALTLVENGVSGAKATLPQGLMVSLGYQIFTIADEGAILTLPADWPQLGQDQVIELQLPGITLIPGTNWQLRASFMMPEPQNLPPFSQPDSWAAYLDADQIGSHLILRTRRPGDTFIPLGLGGHHQKVNEFMINQKIPVQWRGHIPLLADNNRVLWVCGYRPDERVCLRPITQRILYLKFESNGL